MSKAKLARFVVVSSVLMLAGTVVLCAACATALGATEEKEAAPPSDDVRGMLAIALAVSVASGTLGAGYAVGKVGSAALGAASERPELITRALMFVALGEGVAVFGVLGGFLLWLKM